MKKIIFKKEKERRVKERFEKNIAKALEKLAIPFTGGVKEIINDFDKNLWRKVDEEIFSIKNKKEREK